MHIYPAEPVYEVQMRESGNPHHHPQIIEDLKDEARRRGLWNLFQPHPQWGPGLSNLEYAHSLRSWDEVRNWHPKRATATPQIPGTWKCSRSSAPMSTRTGRCADERQREEARPDRSGEKLVQIAHPRTGHQLTREKPLDERCIGKHRPAVEVAGD